MKKLLLGLLLLAVLAVVLMTSPGNMDFRRACADAAINAGVYTERSTDYGMCRVKIDGKWVQIHVPGWE